MTEKNIVNFLYEIGQLKNNPRTGWHVIGIKNPESVADHTCRSTFISFILGKMEKVNAEKCALISAFHEMPETRVSDMHKITQNYVLDRKAIEKQVVKEQCESLPKEIGDSFFELYNGFESDDSPEHIVAKDADYLEVVMQAKEYISQGFKDAQNWIDNSAALLKTKSAKKLFEIIVKSEPKEWYEHLKRIER